MKKALLWDFDGVIVDSIDECLITAYNTYLRLEGKKSDFIPEINHIPKGLKEGFYKLRKYVRPAGEYSIIFKAQAGQICINSYVDFKRLLEKESKNVKVFQKEFYSTRRYFLSRYPRNWYSLHKIYPAFKHCWDMLSKEFAFFIVSNKDRNSILRVLHYFNLVIKKKNVFGEDFCLKKVPIITHILKREAIAPQNAFFIDDNYQHLLEASICKVNLLFATWGYGDQPKKMRKDIVSIKLDCFKNYLLRRK